jgi:hypothetical protein
MTDQSIEDASRIEFEAAHKELYGDTCRYRINKETGKYIENGEQIDWELWQAARQSSQSELVASEELRKTIKPRALEYSLDDYWLAPSGQGDLKHQWLDKPHRLIYDLIAALLAAPQQAIPSGWLPIETAPKDGTLIDVWIAGEFSNRWAGVYWGFPHHSCGEMGDYCDSDWHYEKEGWVNDFNMTIQDEITHWMPIPASPTAPIESDK